jgi:hypothetical protein
MPSLLAKIAVFCIFVKNYPVATAKLSKQEQDKLTKLILEVESKDDARILSALKSLSTHGHAAVIEPLIKLWNQGVSDEVEKQIVVLLHGLKDSSTIEPLMEAFRNPSNEALKRKLVVSFWNSKLDFSPYLADFVMFAIDGDFLDALESLTLIENLETIPTESTILESQLLLSEYFNQERQKDEQKDNLLAEIAVVVEGYARNEGAEDLYLD